MSLWHQLVIAFTLKGPSKCDGDSLIKILQPVNPPLPDPVPDWVMVRFQAEALLTSEMMRGLARHVGPSVLRFLLFWVRT